MADLSPARERGLLWLLALTQFTIIMDFMVMMPLGPQIMHAFAISPAAFATAVSAYSWCSGLSGLFAATYIDRFDRRRLLLVIYGLFALSNLVCATAGNFHMLLLARAFAGLSGGVLASIIMTIVSDIIPVSRRGAATGVIMTAFSLAAIAGVPAGIVLGAHLGWSSPFYLLVVLSLLIWLAAAWLVPSLRLHLQVPPPPLRQVLPELWRLLSDARHVRAFGLTFIMMVSHMMVIPFISPVLVANHGIAPQQIAWIYMAGGAATFFTSRRIGRLADRYGKHQLFRIMALFSMLPILFVTHLPQIPFLAVVAFFPVFMVALSGRMIPLQALLTTVPEPQRRGAFLSVNSAIQSLGNGCGAWLGGLLLSAGSGGQILGYGNNGWCAVLLVGVALWWVGRVHALPALRSAAATS
ncbi:MFS transporter [Aquitalea magnusonii]|uniref:Putative MFS family arabinose efflux permease n=1 Tax=Aquitalea magnusonii TaxID=332411 RepID=A0A318JIH2_9NEIS|nr:MFS transporter [Aquitalea magnusonii]PXX48770.1 putative MFS family arabinose efflux permease [Aquitalea magnusonii]